jgi:DNA-binding SARP family transcriptional activator
MRLALLNGFELRRDEAPVPLPLSAQRVLAFVALHDQPILRSYVAGKLWLDSADELAAGSLRSALWRLRQSGHELVQTDGQRLWIADGLAIDAREAAAWAQRVLEGTTHPDDDGLAAFPLAGELLPDWYDDWVLLERERLRELRVHALECLCERLIDAGRFGEAMEAAQLAVKFEPLRESCHRRIVRVHLAEGNQAEALRHYRSYRRLLRDQLGLEPSELMAELVEPLRQMRLAYVGDAAVTGR